MPNAGLTGIPTGNFLTLLKLDFPISSLLLTFTKPNFDF